MAGKGVNPTPKAMTRESIAAMALVRTVASLLIKNGLFIALSP
jgi:hypothetical protein